MKWILSFTAILSFVIAQDIAPASNVGGDIIYDGNCFWVASERGLSRSCDGGNTWDNIISRFAFSSLINVNRRIFAASSYDTTIGGESYPAGGNLFRSYPGDYSHWDIFTPWQMTYIPSISYPLMLSYDMAFAVDGNDTILFSANWYGGFTKSMDFGASWKNIIFKFTFGDTILAPELDSGKVIDTAIAVPSDVRSFVIANGISLDEIYPGYPPVFPRLFFSVAVDTSSHPNIVFAGTAAGIFRFAIGDSIFHRIVPDSLVGITGHWIVALAVQYLPTGSVIWASTRSIGVSGMSESDGICYSTDGGVTWDTLATGLWCWNFAFNNNSAYFACEQGLYKSEGFEQPQKIEIIDSQTGFILPLDRMVSVINVNDTLIASSEFGLAVSYDGGETFTLHFSRPTPLAEQTYAFPSPFSPYEHGTIFFVFPNPSAGLTEIILYDMALEEIKRWKMNVEASDRTMAQWDGKMANGEYPSNGIYFYKIIRSDGKEFWGKFVYLR